MENRVEKAVFSVKKDHAKEAVQRKEINQAHFFLKLDAVREEKNQVCFLWLFN